MKKVTESYWPLFLKASSWSKNGWSNPLIILVGSPGTFKSVMYNKHLKNTRIYLILL